MKLRNKKTGEIIDIYKGEITLHYNQGKKTIHFKHLEDLEDWEDYEEPKEYWFISDRGEIFHTEDNMSIDEKRKFFGNYFDTREEAEQAVERLHAWKRLKDKGFRFTRYNACSVDYDIDEQYRKYISNDLNLIFGGEE